MASTAAACPVRRLLLLSLDNRPAKLIGLAGADGELVEKAEQAASALIEDR